MSEREAVSPVIEGADEEGEAPVTQEFDDDSVRPVQSGPEAATAEAVAAEPQIAEPAAPVEPEFVYALGQVDARFPSLGVEKEFDQRAALIDTAGLNERQIVKRLISDPEHPDRINPENRDLVRSLCWLLLVQDLETYILMPRDPHDYAVLARSYREQPSDDEVDVVIGTRGPIAPPEMCNGVSVPIVAFDKLYSFTRKALVDAIPIPEAYPTDNIEQFRDTAGRVFQRITQVADNAGATDAHRALNYLVVRYPRLYAAVVEAHDSSASLSGVEVRPSSLNGVRRIVEAIFSFTDRQTDVVTKQFARVDVTEEYPFLVTKLTDFFEN